MTKQLLMVLGFAMIGLGCSDDGSILPDLGIGDSTQPDLVAPDGPQPDLAVDVLTATDLTPSDTAPDLAADVSADAPVDTTVDAPVDTTVDTTVDLPPPDITVDAGSATCLQAPAYQGNASWTYGVTATPTATFCNHQPNATSLEAGLAERVQLRLVDGTYALPESQGNFTATLPFCLSDAFGQSTPDGSGTLATVFQNFGSGTLRLYGLTQSLAFNGSRTIKFTGQVFKPAGQPAPAWTEDGMSASPGVDVSVQICDTPACSAGGTESAYVCNPPVSRTELVTFNRGSVTFETGKVPGLLGPSVAAALLRAHGTLDGVNFDQTNFFRLNHGTDHHNKGGRFLVMFSAPISGACGLKVEIPSVDGSFGIPALAAWTVDCTPAVLDVLAGVAHTPPP